MQAPYSLQALLPKRSVGARAVLLWGKRWYDVPGVPIRDIFRSRLRPISWANSQF